MSNESLGTLYYEIEADTEKLLTSISTVNKNLGLLDKEVGDVNKSFKTVDATSASAGRAIKGVGDKSRDAGIKMKALAASVLCRTDRPSKSASWVKQCTAIRANRGNDETN